MSGPSAVVGPCDVGTRYLRSAMRAELARFDAECMLASMAHDRCERERARQHAYAVEDAVRAAYVARRGARRRAARATGALALASVAAWTVALSQLAGAA